MFENKKPKNWTDYYWNHIKRNIGLIKIEEQEKLRNTHIAILGVGGLGGPLSEQLIRVGCENLVICDNEKYDESNLNRQLCTIEDLGKYKVDITEEFLKKINPEIKIQKFYNISKKNISKILENISIVALTLDDPITSILIMRECLQQKIPVLESWGIPYLWAWWFTPRSIDYETCYGFETQKMKIEDIKKSKETIQKLKKSFLNKIIQFPGIREIYDREKGSLEGMFTGKLSLISLAPIVRMTASYLAFETIFSGILNVKQMILAPNIIAYDYIRMKLIKLRL